MTTRKFHLGMWLLLPRPISPYNPRSTKGKPPCRSGIAIYDRFGLGKLLDTGPRDDAEHSDGCPLSVPPDLDLVSIGFHVAIKRNLLLSGYLAPSAVSPGGSYSNLKLAIKTVNLECRRKPFHPSVLIWITETARQRDSRHGSRRECVGQGTPFGRWYESTPVI